jgi:hypothetical protein
MTIEIIDDVLIDIDDYVSEVLSNQFIDIQFGEQIFRGIHPRCNDRFQRFIESKFTEYDVAFNFVRQSPLNQEEPNYIHSDEMMGDLTVLLYLNKCTPDNDGTILYDNDESVMCSVKSKYNRCFIFPSHILHSRSLFNNFGIRDAARLVQVIFLKQK